MKKNLLHQIKEKIKEIVFHLIEEDDDLQTKEKHFKEDVEFFKKRERW